MQTNVPEISVVVVGLNEEKNISTCLKSLISQKTARPYEIIFVDGGSKDSTVKTVESFAGGAQSVTVITQPGKGIGDAREAGFKRARGALIFSFDADSVAHSDWLEVGACYFAKHPEVVGVVGRYAIEGSPLQQKVFLAGMRFFDTLQRLISGFYAFRGINFAVRQSAWKAAGGFNTNISALEDVELALRVSKVGRIAFLPNWTVQSSGRRFRGNLLRSNLYRLKAYYYRVFRRDNTKFTQWERVG